MQKASNKETLALANPTLLSALRDENDLAGLIAYLTADLAKNQTIPSLRKGINKLNIYREEMDRVVAQCQTAKDSKTATEVNLTYNANFARMSAYLKAVKPKIEELDSILTRLNPLFGCLKSTRPASTIASLQKASQTAQYDNITSLGLLELLTRIICLSCTSSAGVITALKGYNLYRVKKGKAHPAAATKKFVVTTSRDAAHWLDPLNVLFSRYRNQVRPSLPLLTSGGGIHLVDRLSTAAQKAYLETEARVGSLLRQQQKRGQQCSPEAVAKIRTDSHTKFRNTHPDAPAPMARCHRCMYMANYKINDPAVQAAEAAQNQDMKARTIDGPKDFHLGWLCAEIMPPGFAVLIPRREGISFS
ncbi:hypothetical protein B0H63DRAFT_508077 [Podospora didyma]|uniref:Uncharacterized protein n=1 Tax=Podospora didyma TaxID=330526 RepID=A0AAE0U4Z8_9PEZI|nr:hypothetical protein B0H63DRAFT_508077 [Podospora didyma]